MKFTQFFTFTILLSLIFSCQEGVKKVETTSVPTDAEMLDNSFNVTLKVIATKDDDFCVLFTEDGSINFKEGVWKEVKGAPTEQIIKFSLPSDVIPTQLRLDLGKNATQTDLVLKSVQFEYQGNARLLEGVEMGAFFRADESKCTFDPVTGIIKSVMNDGVLASPSLYPHETTFAAEIPKLVR